MGIYARRVPAYSISFLIAIFMFLFIFNCTVSGEDASITGSVADQHTEKPIVNATVTVSYLENETVVAIVHTDSMGQFQVLELAPDMYLVVIGANGYYNKSEEIELEEGQSYELNVLLVQYGSQDALSGLAEGSTFSLCYQTGFIVAIVLVVSIVMYSKIKRENLLKNAIRKRIYHHIKENPGKHYRAILSDLDLSMGVLTYHLNRLEKAQYIKSKQDGMFRRFYPPGPKTDVKFFLSGIQESILSVINENKGISQSKIADKIGVSRKVVNYHVNILDQAGLIFIESHGRESACYLIEQKTGAGVVQ